MLTIILNVSSKTADTTQYTELLKDGDALHAVEDSESIVEKYNEIVEGSNPESDIMLISDRIDIHGNILVNMTSCLYAAEKHAFVYGQEIENHTSLINTAVKYLPAYSITIHANVNCALIKRTVINMLGFLDVSYSSLQYALMDFYCRVNVFGFSAVVSHHALYSYKNESKSQNEQADDDMELFALRYSYWAEKEKRFALHDSQAYVGFLKLFDNEFYPKKRILFDCITMPPEYCGTSEYQLSVFNAFYRLFGDKYDIYLYTNRSADEFHKLSEKYGDVLYPETISGKFHLGYAPNQLMLHEHQSTLNNYCMRIVQTMFDIVMVRIDEHLGMDANSDVESGIVLSDGIMFISNAAKNDFMAYFRNDESLNDIKCKVIYLTTGFDAPEKNDYDLPFEDYFMVIGNTLRHKAITETMAAITNSQYNFIIVGSEDDGYIQPNIYGYKSGKLEDNFLSCLYASCKAVIFPSLYEGFGFPVVMALKNNKYVVVNNNALNNELREHFSQFKEYFLLFDRFEQITDIIEDADFLAKPGQAVGAPALKYDDTWDRVAGELEAFFEDILRVEIDYEKLYKRWSMFRLMDAKILDAGIRYSKLNDELSRFYGRFGSDNLLKLFLFTFKEHIKQRRPGLFRFLMKVFRRGYI